MFCSMHKFVSKTLSLNLCHCYFKYGRLKSLLALHQYLRQGYLLFQNFWETWKGTWYHKTLEECRETRKIKIHIWTVWLCICSWAFFSPLKTWKKIK